LSIQVFQLLGCQCRLPRIIVELVEDNAEEYTIEKDDFSEPVNAFVEGSVVLELLDAAEALLLDDDAVHRDFKTVEEIPQPDEGVESQAVLLAVDVLEALRDVVVDRPQEVPNDCHSGFSDRNRHGVN